MRAMLGAALILLALSGCAGEPATFRDAVRPYTASAADDAARDRMGDAACRTIRQDNVTSVSQAAQPFIRGGLSEQDATAVVKAAVKHLCPDAAGKR